MSQAGSTAQDRPGSRAVKRHRAVLDSAGNCKPAVTATGLIAVGRFLETVSNGAVAGAVSVRVQRGIFRYANSADADAITKAEIDAGLAILKQVLSAY